MTLLALRSVQIRARMRDELVLAIKRVAERELVEKIETAMTLIGVRRAEIDGWSDAQTLGGEEGGRDAE
jgi:hypothetical protein